MENKLFKNSNKIIIYTDGGARGNPGPAAIGVVVGEKKYSEYIGKATNNVAEYRAVILALKKAKHLFGKKTAETEIEMRMDSELIQRQLSGIYRVKEDELKILFVDVHNLKFDFKKISFVHIPREKNKEADKLVNEELDKQKTSF